MRILDIIGSDQRVCQAARVSLGGDTDDRPEEDDIKLIRYLRKHNHTSPFEHVRLRLSFPQERYSMPFLRQKLRTECVTRSGTQTIVTCDLHNLLLWLDDISMTRERRQLAERLPASAYPMDATSRSARQRLVLDPLPLDNAAGFVALVEAMSGGRDDDKHCVITFRCHVPKFIAVQHMRHRTWSFNEISRRYTSAMLETWQPISLRRQAKKNLQASDGTLEFDEELRAMMVVDKAHSDAIDAYETLLEMGLTREQARTVLPMGTMTTYYATAPLKWVKHFMRLRLHSGAQPEITTLAERMREICTACFPKQMESWK